MTIYENPYSKHRFDNTKNVTLRVDPCAHKVDMSGTELRGFGAMIKSQLTEVSPVWLNNGATWVLNNVYEANQTTTFDQPMGNRKLRFFRLFKL